VVFSGRFFSPLGRAWGVFFVPNELGTGAYFDKLNTSKLNTGYFFVVLCSTDFISVLLVFSKYLLIFFGAFSGVFRQAQYRFFFAYFCCLFLLFTTDFIRFLWFCSCFAFVCFSFGFGAFFPLFSLVFSLVFSLLFSWGRGRSPHRTTPHR